MVQKKVVGITLQEFNIFIRRISNKERERLEQDVQNFQKRIGFRHGDLHDGNVMVDRDTGEFVALIDWDFASPIVDENYDRNIHIHPVDF